MATDPRFLAAQGSEVFTGNELLVKGCLEVEGGVPLLTGYPGSPVAGFFDTMGDIKTLLAEKGMRAYQANNEALAAAALNGSQMLAIRGVVVMKSVGLHVASDALAIGHMAGAHPEGGAVVICGDDPWCESTQVPADSRFLFQHMRMPVVEPGGPQQLKDWVDLCFKLSRAGGAYIGYLVTNAHADGGGTVECRPNHYPAVNMRQKQALDTAGIDLDKVLLPPRTWQHELAMAERLKKTIAAARELGINDIFDCTAAVSAARAGGTPAVQLGFIVTGMAGPYLNHLLGEIGLGGQFPVLQMGMSYPVDIKIVQEFSRLCGQMIVIEERRSFLEMNIRDAAFRELPHEEAVELVGKLFGKQFPSTAAVPAERAGGTPAVQAIQVEGIPETRGLNYSVLAQKLIPLFQRTHSIPEHLRNGRLSAELQSLRAASRPRLEIFSEKLAARTPTFCPGCPHRDSSSVLLDLRKNLADPAYMKRAHNMGPVDLVAHGDTGCYTMLMFAPTEQLMHNYSGMGLGAGTGTGIDPFITNKQIVFMGDGTFFHSGQLAISNSVKAGQDITFIILENGTTAMTGHQDHAAVDEDMFGNKHAIMDIKSMVMGMSRTAPIRIYKANPAEREIYMKSLEEAILAPGVKVVIAEKECGITHHRRKNREERKVVKEKGYLPTKTYMNITPEVCENCLECTKQTACPGLTMVETDYGRKVDTDLTWCVNDGACERVRVSNEAGLRVKPCPSFEQVTLVRSHRRRYLLPQMSLDKLPDPQKFAHDMSPAGASWRCHISGVGGMGIGVVGAIVVRAGHLEGYRIVFQEKKGLAIRNGGVFAQVTYVRDADDRQDEIDEQAGKNKQIANRKSQIANFPTGSIPYGKADLLLGIDILEATRAIDPREDFRVASAGRTCAVLNLHKQPTVYTLLGRSDFDPEELRKKVMASCREECSYAKNLAEICEQRLGSKQFVNIMMLGVAFQLGLIPVSAHSIAWAIKDTIRREHRRNLKAFNIGRKLALEPRALPAKPEPRTWEQLLTNKSKILRKTRLFGPKLAGIYEKLTLAAMRTMADLPAESKYDLTLRIYDIMQFQDEKLARRYIQLIKGVYQRDSSDHAYEATRAVIWNLAKVILIKDEPYCAYLLTRFEKKQRDLAKFGVDVANGDKLIYSHHTRPELGLGQWRFRLNISTSDWMLNLVRHCTFLRKLPGWHSREQAFRDWYIRLLDRVRLDDNGDADAYEQSLQLLSCPQAVSGYREIRYPKMERTREWAENLITGSNKSIEVKSAASNVLLQTR